MQYEAAETVEEAVDLLSRGGNDALPLAGGTDLLAQMRTGRIAPARVVDLKRIPELREIVEGEDGYQIGAAVSGAELGEHSGLVAHWPGVVEAAGLIGSTQIQGRASLGGNLCNASPAADSVPALIAAGAVCSLVGPGGRREMAVEDVVTGPGQTCLAKDEIVAHFRLPRPKPRSGDAYLRLIPRSEMDIAVVGVAVAMTLDGGGLCTQCRVGLGAVAPTALYVPGASAALVGRSLNEDALAELEGAIRAAARPIDDMRGTIAYRIRVAGVLAKRAAIIAAERAGAMIES
ncbi:MAG TPA: xanthine dehydrogenase family protein subunit M [Myxococcales bacterium]|nr:xanthine dehydrogenase family protein subunit M [Myxococcales bacterium]HIL01392.1 xanthine dehydrogenase family protein subunit M [Myxococcales bacterium]